MNKNQMTEFSFEKETDLFVSQYLHVDAEYFCILMSSLSSLINAIFSVSCDDFL